MPRLVTQAVTDLPVVALIGTASPLLEYFTAFFQRHEFVVEVFPFNSLSVAKIPPDKHFYKTLCIDGWSTQTTDYQTVFSVLQTMQKQSTSVHLLQEYLPVTTTEQEYQRKFFRHQVETELPQVNIILGQDVMVSLQLWWIQLATQKISQQIFVDPQIEVFPVSLSTFAKVAQLLILKPDSQQRVIIRGKQQHSTQVLSEMSRQYELYHQKKVVLQAKKIENLEQTITHFFVLQQAPLEQLPALVAELTRQLPSPAGQEKEPQATTESESEPEAKNLVRPSLSAASNQPQVSPLPQKPISAPSASRPALTHTKPTATAPTRTATVVKPVLPASPKIPDSTSDSVDEKLSKLFVSQRTEKKSEHLQEKVTTTKKVVRKNKKRSGLFLGGMVVAGAALAIFCLAAVFAVSQTGLRVLLLTQFSNPKQPVVGLDLARQLLQIQTEAYSLVAPAPFFDTAYEWLALASEWQQVQEVVDESAQKQVALFQQIIAAQEVSPSSMSAQLSSTGYEAVSRLYSRLTADLQESDNTTETQGLRDYVAFLDRQRANFITVQQLSPLLSRLFGEETKRTYAILLQNEQELRASGGFLQAVALVTFDQGQIIDTQVFSVYELDNKLTAAVTPPEDLKQVLAEERWFLRDSNWNPDFPSSAAQITWFLQQLTNKSVDGVIALNVGVVADILRATGPLEMPEYNELLTDRNLAERMEFHSEVTLVETSQVSDYSQLLLQRLLTKLQQLSPEKTPDFLSVMSQQLKEKNMVISLTDKNEEATLSLLGWTGELVQPNCPAQFSGTSCLVDTFAVFDSNVGVNKANYHVTRKDSHQVKLSPTLATHTHTITFTNTSQSNAWPKGDYRSYLRFLLPTSSKLQSITINGTPLFAKDIIVTQQGSFSQVGFVSNTPIKSTSTIEFTYTIPASLETGSAYTLFLQKQPGIEQPLQSIVVNLDPSLSPKLIAPTADVSENIISFSEINLGHMFIGLELQ